MKSSLAAGVLSGLFALGTFAQPAAAERRVCHTSRTADGVRSEVGAVLEGGFERMLIVTGPIFAPLDVSSSSQFRPAANTAKALQFYIFWFGDSKPGADWREPGGVAYELAGFGLQWPSMENSDGVRLKLMRSKIRLGDAVLDAPIQMSRADYSSYSAEIFELHQRMNWEDPFDWEHREVSPVEWPAWIDAFRKGGSLQFDLVDGALQPLGKATLDLPPLVAFNQRAAADIRDFRTRVDPVACPGGARTTVD